MMNFEEFQLIRKDGLYHVVKQGNPQGNSIGIGKTPSAAFLSGYKFLKLMNRLQSLLGAETREFIIHFGGIGNVH